MAETDISNRLQATKEPFEVTLVRLDPKWTSSLMIGVTPQSPDRIHPPVSALALKKGAVVVAGASVYHNGVKLAGHFTQDLDGLQAGHKVGTLNLSPVLKTKPCSGTCKARPKLACSRKMFKNDPTTE
jgi:hypothetical protein